MLARALCGPRKRTFILYITTSQGTKVHTSKSIANEFYKYYRQLYNLHPKDSTEAMTDKTKSDIEYIRASGMPILSDEVRDSLESEITAEEFHEALAQTKPLKALGPDGFTLTYYQSFVTSLTPHFLAAYNELKGDSSMPIDLLRAYISLIPKEGKDLSQCGNYRLIALLNIVLKLFAKILSNRLILHIPRLIHLDQVGFVLRREARDNTIRVLNLIHKARQTGKSFLLLSTDAEKAFDRVSGHFMRATLEYIGLGPNMFNWISSLYSKPMAVVRVNEWCSEFFMIANGMRQGCPLSPLIFILTLEPFLCHIKEDPNITGVWKPSGHHKIAAYADDLIFFVSNPRVSLPNILSAVGIYGELSNFKVNCAKSAVLNITIPDLEARSMRTSFAFRWADKSIRYLGIDITSDLAHLYAANYEPLLQRLKADLRKWHTLTLTWFGHYNALKMTVLPRILYILQTIPIRVPSTYFKQLQMIIREFIWSHKSQRTKMQMPRPKEKGGIGLPDLLQYYRAVHLSKIVDWHCNKEFKQWVRMEFEDVSFPLLTSPWLTCSLPEDIGNHPLVSATLRVARLTFCSMGLAPLPSPMTW